MLGFLYLKNKYLIQYKKEVGINLFGDFVQPIYIQDQQSLKNYCDKVAHSTLLAIDTEFVRTRTLIPNLGLIQAFDGENLALIDPVEVKDLQPFWDLLTDPKLPKIIHSCSEDLDVFLHSGPCKPVNLIDSQVIMAFLGHGLSIGYAAMIKHFLDIEVDKSESRTDWLKRPLSQKQLDYAAADVIYLHQISQKLIGQIEHKGWLSAAIAETHQQVDKKFTPINTDRLYIDFKQSWKLTGQNLLAIKHLLTWRYEQAIKRNLPLSFIAKDATLMTMAAKMPKSVGAMANMEGVDILDIRHQGKAILAILNQVRDLPSSYYPKPITRLDNYPGYKQVFKTLKLKAASLAQEHDLDVQVVAGKRQINQFLAWYWQLNEQHLHTEQVDLLNGWRKSLFAKPLIEFAQNNFK